MPKVEFGRYRVTVIESERGWGQKVDEVMYFDTKEEADAAAWNVNKHNTSPTAPDWYMMAYVEDLK